MFWLGLDTDRKTGQVQLLGRKRDRAENGTGPKTGQVQLLWNRGAVVCSAGEGHAAFEDSDRGMRLVGGCDVSQSAIRIVGERGRVVLPCSSRMTNARRIIMRMLS